MSIFYNFSALKSRNNTYCFKSSFVTSISNIIASWKEKITKYFFYKDGFFQLNQLANSPQLMIQNCINMPFVKYDSECQVITTQNPFLRVKMFHLNFEEGLLLMLSDCYHYQNIMDSMVYNEEPAIHYFISLKVSRNKVKSKNPLVNGSIYSYNMWSICKPAGIKNLYHFKNSHEQFYTLYFTQSWLEKYLLHADEKVKDFLLDFMNSDNTYMMWPRQETLDIKDYTLFKDTLEQNKPIAELDLEVYRKQSLGMFEDFISSVVKEDLNADHLKMSNENRLKIFKAQNYLSNHYTGDFPGLENIAEKVGISPTGLKTGFKQVYGASIYKYFRSQKMKIAFSILNQNKDIQIKVLAAQMGYDNAAKFAAAFKDEMGFLPSEATDNMEVDKI